jgi:hypothetical protein
MNTLNDIRARLKTLMGKMQTGETLEERVRANAVVPELHSGQAAMLESMNANPVISFHLDGRVYVNGRDWPGLIINHAQAEHLAILAQQGSVGADQR